MTKTIVDIQGEIVDEFSMFEDRMEKYEYIIDMGKDLEGLSDELKVEDAVVKGCQSKVWLHASEENGSIHFKADSDAFIVRGLIQLLLRIYSGQKSDDILNDDVSFISKIGLQEMLSPTRSNGLASMVKQMRMYALAFKAKTV